MAAQRVVVTGGDGPDAMVLGTAVAFAWQPDPGEAATFWSEAGHAVWSGESQAAGTVVFLGVAADAAFAATPAGFSFAFTNGVQAGPAAIATGGPWVWNPATGTLDPQAARGGDGLAGFRFTAAEAWEQRVTDPDILYVSGSEEAGRWVPTTVPPLTAMAGAGDDRVVGTAAAERILGGDGADTIAGGGRDTVDGQRGDDLILGGAGRDIASGGSGDDTLRGGDGNDILYGSAGDDLLVGGKGRDHLLGGAGNDRIAGLPGEGDTIAGGEGFDTLDYSGAAPGVVVDLRAGTGGAWDDGPRDRITGVEAVIGTAGWDSFVCGDGGTVIDGGGGWDGVRAGNGDDRFIIGTGPRGPFPPAQEDQPGMSITGFNASVDRLDLRAFGVTRADVFGFFIEHHTSLEVWVRDPATGYDALVAQLWGVGGIPRGVDIYLV